MEASALHSDYLFRLARSGKSDDRAALAKLVSGLLRADLSHGEAFLVQDILLRMLREAESDLRQALAKHLSTEEKCPQALIDYLIFECPLVDSEPMLKNGVMLDEDFLIEVAKRQDTAPYWHTIASRSQVGSKLALYLLGRKDEKTYHILINNKGAEFSTPCMSIITDVAMNIPTLHLPILDRHEITAEFAAKIYWYASEKLKKDIMKRFEIDKATLDTAMWYVAAQRVPAGSKVRSISMEMLDLVRRIPKINTRHIIDALQKDDLAYFSCLCGTVLNISPESILAKMDSRPMFAITVLGKALNISRAQFTNLYLMWRNKSASNTVTTGNDLARAMAAFDQIKTEQAVAEVAWWHNSPA